MSATSWADEIGVRNGLPLFVRHLMKGYGRGHLQEGEGIRQRGRIGSPSAPSLQIEADRRNPEVSPPIRRRDAWGNTTSRPAITEGAATARRGWPHQLTTSRTVVSESDTHCTVSDVVGDGVRCLCRFLVAVAGRQPSCLSPATDRRNA
jgi:hypothetical protein